MVAASKKEAYPMTYVPLLILYNNSDNYDVYIPEVERLMKRYTKLFQGRISCLKVTSQVSVSTVKYKNATKKGTMVIVNFFPKTHVKL